MKLNSHNCIKYANPFPLANYWSRELQQLIEGFLFNLLYIFINVYVHKILHVVLFHLFCWICIWKINTITSLCKFLGLTPTNDGLGIFFFF